MSDSLFDGVLRLLLNQYGYAKVSRRLEAINRSGKLGVEPELSRDLGGAHPQIDYRPYPVKAGRAPWGCKPWINWRYVMVGRAMARLRTKSPRSSIRRRRLKR